MFVEKGGELSNRLEYFEAMNPLVIFENTAVAVSFTFVLGTLIGSFLNVLIWRLPREENAGGRSHCPKCKHELIWRDLIPVLSLLLAGGKCRYCKSKVSLRYPIIEVATGALFALATFVLPVVDFVTSLVLVKVLFVISVCVIVFVVDLEHFLILDKIVFPAIAVVVALLLVTDVLSGTTQGTIYGLIAALAVFVPFWLLWYLSKGKWMGFGDVKFMVFMGLALGLPGILVAMFVSFGIGAITGIGLILSGKKQLGSKLPFGTFLTIATVVTLLFGTQLWQGYWDIFLL